MARKRKHSENTKEACDMAGKQWVGGKRPHCRMRKGKHAMPSKRLKLGGRTHYKRAMAMNPSIGKYKDWKKTIAMPALIPQNKRVVF